MLNERAAHQLRFFTAIVLVTLATTPFIWADIYRWDNGQVIPGTEGITPGPGVQLSNRQLEYASLNGLNVGGANFNNSNLAFAHLGASTLTKANLAGAIVTGADFAVTASRGFNKEQLYSTASYQQMNLQGIGLIENNLSGWDLSAQNLTNAELDYSTLANTNFAGAIVTGTSFHGSHGFTKEQLYSTASYQQKNLQGIGMIKIILTHWDFSGQNLSNADFGESALRDANLAGAIVNGADFRFTTVRGFTKEQLYSTASYRQKNLQGIRIWFNELSGWDLSGQDLTNASFNLATLTNANLTAASVIGTNFSGTGLTKEQLYSTASYEQRNLQGIGLQYENLTDWNLSGRDLTNADFDQATLTGANFTGAIVAGADFRSTTGRGFTKEQLYSTVSYQQKNLEAIGFGPNDLTGWDLSGQNLTNASFDATKLTAADLTDAIITGADFTWTTYYGFTKEQLYTTASYKQKNLQRIQFGYDGADISTTPLNGWDFSRQDLREASLYSAVLTDANLAGANLTNAGFSGARLTNADLTSADMRGAIGVDTTGAILRNVIRDDGAVFGLDLAAGNEIIIRDYDGDLRYDPPGPPIPIIVQDHFGVSDGSTLRLVFESDVWDSVISFASGIPVTLDGTLELAFAPDVDLQSQVGRTLRLFDWSSVTPTGAFAVRSPYTWDLSRLYTTGEVTLLAIPEPQSLVLFLCGIRAFVPHSPRRRR